MVDTRIAAAVTIGLLISVAITPGAAAQPDVGDDCMNADRGSGDDGPPGFVADLVPNFISDLIGGLPVPNFVKSFFGAVPC